MGFLGRSFRICFGLRFLSKFFFVRLNLTIDVFLQLCLRFVHVHIVNQLVVRLGSHSHQLWLATVSLAIDMLHDFVIGAKLLLVRRHHTIHTIYRCVSYKLLEVRHLNEVANIRMEHNIVSHANLAIDVLVVLALADAVREPPRCASFAIRLGDFLPLWLINSIVIANVNKGLLVEELLLEVADHLLTEGLDTEASIRLDQLSANGKLTALLHLSQVLIVLWPMLWV